MLPLLLVLAAAPAAAAQPAATATGTPSCIPPSIVYANPPALPPRLRKLGDEPPASQYLAVKRHVGGCPAPAVVRTGIGRGR